MDMARSFGFEVVDETTMEEVLQLHMEEPSSENVQELEMKMKNPLRPSLLTPNSRAAG
jgi:hypothetical protein